MSRTERCRFQKGVLHLDGTPRYLLAADYPYYRDDPANWRARLEAQVEAGLDVLSFYVPWRHHATGDPLQGSGRYDFTGRTQTNRDVVRFLRLAAELDLNVIVKPGPFVHAELPFGGLPDFACGRHNPDAGIEPERQATGEPREWRLPGMDAESVRVLPAPFGRAFHEYASHWLAALTREVLRGKTWPEGPVVAVQLMNEGIYSDSSTAEPTQFAFSDSSIARYRAFLGERYASLEAYASAHRRRIGSWDDVSPPRRAGTLGRVEDLLAYLDWSAFQGTVYGSLARRYKRVMVDAGLPEEMPALFNFNPNGSTYRDRPASNDGWYTRVCGPDAEDLVFGSTNWLGVASGDASAFRQYVMAITTRRGPAMEQNWGFATQYYAPYEFVTPSAFESMVATAFGATGLTAYTFAGTRAWREDANLTGEWMPPRMNGRDDETSADYPGDSPVLSNGERTPKFWTLMQMAQFLGDESPAFIDAGIRAPVGWATYAPYAWSGQWLPRGDPDDILWRPPLKAVPRGAFHGLDAFVEMMLREGVAFRQADLAGSLDDAPPILCLSSHEYMDLAAQERLARHVESGGGLVLTNLVPERDELLRPRAGPLAERIFPHGQARVLKVREPTRLELGGDRLGFAMEFAHAVAPPADASDLVRMNGEIVGYSRRVGRGIAVYLGVGPWRAELSGDDRVVAHENQAFVWGFVEGIARQLGVAFARPRARDAGVIVTEQGTRDERCVFVVSREHTGEVRVELPELGELVVTGASQAVHAVRISDGRLVAGYVRGMNDVRAERVTPEIRLGRDAILADAPCDLAVSRRGGETRVSVAHSERGARVRLVRDGEVLIDDHVPDATEGGVRSIRAKRAVGGEHSAR